MTDYTKIKAVFAAASGLSPETRADFYRAQNVDDSCRQEVESLFKARDEAGNFLEDISAAEVVQASMQHSNLVGERIDQYRIKNEIGRGGMGVVFLAEREDFHQTVALKLIKRGMDSDAILDRFTREREILASLNHPFIARLLDGGTTEDGRPFYVMEFVDGTPVDEYCRARGLSEADRLNIFRKICSAVQSAHQKLVLHRDLKPSNILVRDDGTPKLLDFGIAKILDETDANFTQTHQRAFTPAYASPEQMRGEKAGTTSDVYSLGLVLSEILGIQAPISPPARNGATNLSQPSTRKGRSKNRPRTLNADLENIIEMSLHSDPSRRYASCDAFSDDVERYLKGEPVAAHRDSSIYRAKKFVQRNRLTVAITAATFLLLLGGIFAVRYQAAIGDAERAKAERRAENLRKLSSSFAIELHNAILNLPGSLPARQLLLTRAVEQLDALAIESDGKPELQDQLAQGYYALSELPNVTLADVERNIDKGVRIYDGLIEIEPQNALYRKGLAKGYELEANVHKVRGETNRELEFLEKSAKIMDSVSANHPEAWEYRSFLFDVDSELAATLFSMGQAREALAASRKAQAIGREMVEQGHITGKFDQLAALLHFNESKSLTYLGEYKQSLELINADFDLIRLGVAANPNDTRFTYELWAYHRTLASTLDRDGQGDGALAHAEAALKIMKGLLKVSPDDVGYQRNTAFTYLMAGRFYLRRDNFEKALELIREAQDLSEKILSSDPEKGETIEDLANIYASLGDAEIGLSKTDEGKRAIDRAIDFCQRGLLTDSENAIFRRDLAETLARSAQRLSDRGQSNEAIRIFRVSYDLLEPLAEASRLDASDRPLLQRMHNILAL